MARILKRNFNGGPLDGEQRLLNSTVAEWREVEPDTVLKESKFSHGQDLIRRGCQHLYKLGSDAEFHYKGEF